MVEIRVRLVLFHLVISKRTYQDDSNHFFAVRLNNLNVDSLFFAHPETPNMPLKMDVDMC